jgi:hypothetical protein
MLVGEEWLIAWLYRWIDRLQRSEGMLWNYTTIKCFWWDMKGLLLVELVKEFWSLNLNFK